jgi:hypothetical protein
MSGRAPIASGTLRCVCGFEGVCKLDMTFANIDAHWRFACFAG